MSFNKEEHWEHIYNTKKLSDVSWYQKEPITAIEYLNELKLDKQAAIIDIGCGDSFLVDYLLEKGYTNITVLDISTQSLARAQKRLGSKANQVHWIVADAATFKSDTPYDFWYDRATFHFLTDQKDVQSYVHNLDQNLAQDARVVIGTFSENGPAKCSGIDITKYSPTELSAVFSNTLHCISHQYIDHLTPFNTIQNFSFCLFSKK